MALIGAQTVKVTLSFKDRDQNTGQFQYNVPNTLTIAEIQIGAAAMGLAVAGISDATFTGYSASYSAFEDAPALAGEMSDVERKGAFTFRDSGGYSTSIEVPSVKNTLVIDRTQFIDLTDVSVLSFVGAFTTGVLLTARPASNHGLDFATVTRAVKTHRKSSKG